MKRSIVLMVSVLFATGALLTLLVALDAQHARAGQPEQELTAPLLQITPVYTVTDSNSGGPPFDWVDIVGLPDTELVLEALDPDRPLGGDNDQSVLVDIGFHFPFYSDVYRQLRVSTNGYIRFGDGLANGILNAVGSSSEPNNVVAAFGGDMYMPSFSNAYVRREADRTIIEFVNVMWCCGLNDPHTFEVILYPDGRILVQYLQIRYLSNPHNWVVVGIENPDGADYRDYYQDWFDENAALEDGLAVLFDPGDSLFGEIYSAPDVFEQYEDPGRVLTFASNLINMSGVAGTFNLTYSLHVSSSVVPMASLWPVSVPSATGVVSCPGSVPLHITTTIPITAAWDDLATLIVTATGGTPVGAPQFPPVTATLTITYGRAQRNLRLQKQFDPDHNLAPAPGGAFAYRLEVTNLEYDGSGRGATARDVVITDVLPLLTTLTGFASVDDGTSVTTATVSGHTVFTWSIPTIPNGGTADLLARLEQTPPASAGARLTNTAWATMTGSLERGPFDDNWAEFAFDVDEPRLDLWIEKEFPGPDRTDSGVALTYTVSFGNAGNVYVDDVVITDTLPQSTTFVATTWPDYTVLDNQVVFVLSQLNNGYWNGDGFQIGVYVSPTIPYGTLLTNTVEITTSASLAHFVSHSGDSAIEVVEVLDTRGDPWVDKQLPTFDGGAQIPEPGGDYRFWISFGNGGMTALYTVTLTDTLPFSYVTLLDASPAFGIYTPTVDSGVITWSLPTLGAWQQGQVWVQVKVDENTPAGTRLVNSAGITAALGSNLIPYNDHDVVTATLQGADVTIVKSVIPTGTLCPRDTLTYVVSFGNTGALTATGVVISDALPAGLTNVAWVTSGASITLVSGPSPLVWEPLEPLVQGDAGIITITAELDPNATWHPLATLTNTAHIATVKGEEPDDDPNTAVVTNVVALADPYLVKTGPTLALPGELLTYTLEYGNPGRLDAADVWLTDTLPTDAIYFTDTSGYSANVAGNQVGWFLGDVPSRTTGFTFDLVVSLPLTTPAGIVLVNTAAITTTGYDGDRANNEDVWYTPLGYDLSRSFKQVNGADGLWVDPATQVTYTMVLTNVGPYSATGIVLSDPLPDNTEYVDGSLTATDGDWGYGSGVITWTGTVIGYSGVTVTFRVTVAGSAPLPRGTAIINTAVISDGYSDIRASVPVTLTGPDLSGSTKTVDNAGPLQGSGITYTILLSNSGELDASAAVTDDLPSPEVTYTGNGWASSGSLGSGDPITWTGVVTAGRWVTITLPVTVNAGSGVSFDNDAYIDDSTGIVLARSQRATVHAPHLDNASTCKEASASNVHSGDPVTFTITIVNNGEGDALSALMTDALSPGTDYAGGGSASAGVFDDSGDPVITWTGSLAASGGRVDINIPVVITATPGSDVPNLVQIDDGEGNVFGRWINVHVYSAEDLSGSSKEVYPPLARRGDLLTYTLTASNTGETATGFLVTDTLDVGTLFDGFASGGGSYGEAGGVITWTGTVAPLSQEILVFHATISPTAGAAVTNVAHFDDTDENVYTRTATTVVAEAELHAVKLVTPSGEVAAGERLTYTIALSNSSFITAQVVLTDPIPAHTVYVPPAVVQPPGYPLPQYDVGARALTWDSGPSGVASGQAVTLTFTVWVSSGVAGGTVISNVATLDVLNDVSPAFTTPEVRVRVTGGRLFLPLVLRSYNS